jgi:CRP-like cAMP-binding protein
MAIDPNILKSFPDLNDLSPTDRKQMAASLKESRLRAGAQICREGDVGDSCWFLVEGNVEVIKVLPDGRRVKLATLGPGITFGQSGLVSGQARTAEVKATADVYILALTQKSLRWALGRGDHWAVAVQAIIAVSLVRQLRSALGRLSELAAAEDASIVVTGRSRDQIVKPKSIEVDFSKVRAKQAAATAENDAMGGYANAAEEVAAELAEYEGAVTDGEHLEPLSDQGLLNLLRHTEAGLSGSAFTLEDVEFVMDDDMRRTAEARGTAPH